jgi:hypothetical protein
MESRKCYQISVKGTQSWHGGLPKTINSKIIFLHYPTSEDIEAFKIKCLAPSGNELADIEEIVSVHILELELVD